MSSLGSIPLKDGAEPADADRWRAPSDRNLTDRTLSGTLMDHHATWPLSEGPAPGAVPAPLPRDEANRLRALYALDILDTAVEPGFDDVAAVAAAVCGTPSALVSLIDADRQWFKATVGLELDATETDRDSAFCAHTILHDHVMEVPDTLEDDRFATNPLVLSGPRIRFYAGAPLVTSSGHALGSLCVIDSAPQRLDDHQRAALEGLARIVVGKIEARRTERILQRLTSSLMALSRLHDASQATAAAAAIVRINRELLDADGVTLLLSEDPVAGRYRSFGASTAAAIADQVRGASTDVASSAAIARVVSTAEPLYIGDAAASDLVDPALVARFDVGSILYVPVVGQDGVVGVLVTWWDTPRPVLGGASRDAAVLLAVEAGTTLARLHALAILRRDADTDPLTGLANRRACLAELGQLPPDSAVIIVDLDHFKAVNDTYGHQAGDRLLERFAAHLREATRRGDVVARWGGEEFLVVLPGGGVPGAAMLTRLRVACRAADLGATFSAGLAVTAPDETAEEAVGRADEALYHAKAQGRDRDVIAPSPMVGPNGQRIP